MARLYRTTSTLALVLFVGVAVVHLLALMHVVAPPVGVAAAVLPLIFFGQIVLIIGLNGGSLRSQRTGLNLGRQWRLGLTALRHIPRGWKFFGLPFWYAYVPATFFYRVARAGGTVEEAGGTFVLKEHGRVIRTLTAQEAFASRADMFVGFSVIVMAFAFAHFLLLRFVVPNREAIVADGAGTGAP